MDVLSGPFILGPLKPKYLCCSGSSDLENESPGWWFYSLRLRQGSNEQPVLSRCFSLAKFKLVLRFYCKIHKFSKGVMCISWHNGAVTFVELDTAHSLWAPARMPAIPVIAGISVTGYLAAAVNHRGWAVEGLAMWHRTEVVLLASVCKQIVFYHCFFYGRSCCTGGQYILSSLLNGR